MTQPTLDEELRNYLEQAFSEPIDDTSSPRTDKVMQMVSARDAAVRIDELEQLAEFEMLDGITVHGRHDRSFNDRIAQLRRESDQAKEES